MAAVSSTKYNRHSKAAWLIHNQRTDIVFMPEDFSGNKALRASTNLSFYPHFIIPFLVICPYSWCSCPLNLFTCIILSSFLFLRPCISLSLCLSLPPTLSFVLTAFHFFLQWGSHWVHIYNLAFHFMASGNGCFTAFIKACSSQRRVFPLKFSSMNLAIRGHYGPRFQGTVEHCII